MVEFPSCPYDRRTNGARRAVSFRPPVRIRAPTRCYDFLVSTEGGAAWVEKTSTAEQVGLEKKDDPGRGQLRTCGDWPRTRGLVEGALAHAQEQVFRDGCSHSSVLRHGWGGADWRARLLGGGPRRR